LEADACRSDEAASADDDWSVDEAGSADDDWSVGAAVVTRSDPARR
jgi:hypothetical protein